MQVVEVKLISAALHWTLYVVGRCYFLYVLYIHTSLYMYYMHKYLANKVNYDLLITCFVCKVVTGTVK